MQSDLFAVMRATTDGTLERAEVRFSGGASCCVVLASGGYPKQYETGKPITGIAGAERSACVYHAGTRLDGDGNVLTAGGRVLGVTAVAETLPEAIQKAYAAADHIHFDGLHRRSDIGARALKALE